MTALYLLEPDHPGAAWAPFAGVRPIAELRAGLWRIRERWEAACDATATAILGSHVEAFHEGDEPPVRAPGPVEGPAVIGASTFAPAGDRIAGLGRLDATAAVRRLRHQGTTVGWVVPAGHRWTGPDEGGEAIEVGGLLLRGSFDLLTALEQFLGQDCADLRAAPSTGVPEGSIVLGDPAGVVVMGASIEPGVVFDVRRGAVVLEAGVEVRHGTRLEGPLFAGTGTRLLGGFIRASAFGPECRVHGEIAASVFFGYANKSHDGFVGHSVVGHWVNLGALTTTSNLKNTYGPVRLDLPGARIETGRQNIGTIFGDHAKTAIGTMLATGTVIGAGAQLFGPSTPPKYVPPFAWGSEGDERQSADGFLRVAERVMIRRSVELTPERRRALERTYARGTGG
jgi:UDP-N-acetylglucosamine diphosphorylase / glucose-1-phosphate thymidylyltransferase / UDP-N-acetylgalactosamine diphosphorylase / glucosamine-1-phosphate N-acetyltransferase / galactosamine-1-phosphate N-acetyltransferase